MKLLLTSGGITNPSNHSALAQLPSVAAARSTKLAAASVCPLFLRSS
ncbi:hypothetical protein DFJ67_1931 [Asanoa ferruginea]|uniref:Uncharacterized protein n=1 Tax=Asanoa ferruginea TaxID=53367 RepID=A0A3D9ZEW8_9ACTN|nr:hypothetical protein [Asanoa ferruginea]REF95966.1 hypothetical protein DFJ67_1931 [Asanoa ferruginea]